MKVLYARVSSINQKTDRQTINESDYKHIVEDKCSGAIPFFERPGGKEILMLIDKGILSPLGNSQKGITTLSVWTIDRLGRNLFDILNTINYFNGKNICIEFISQGLKTLDDKGKENPISKMIISILGIVAEMERNQSKERQKEGIYLAKLKGTYKGRKPGSSEDTLDFLMKDKNKKALDLLKKGYKGKEISKILEMHPNTITKIKRVGLQNL
jgi:DNA invertase Pin-like site-specific DNA recombinase